MTDWTAYNRTPSEGKDSAEACLEAGALQPAHPRDRADPKSCTHRLRATEPLQAPQRLLRTRGRAAPSRGSSNRNDGGKNKQSSTEGFVTRPLFSCQKIWSLRTSASHES